MSQEKIKIRNICNDIGKGAFHHSERFSPQSHVLPFEPYLGDFQLRLEEELYIDKGFVLKHIKYLTELKEARIIDFQIPEDREPEVTIIPVKIDLDHEKKGLDYIDHKVKELVEEDKEETVEELVEESIVPEETETTTAEKIFNKKVSPKKKKK